MGRNRATHTFGGEVRFENVAGIEEEKEEVMEIVDFLRNPRKFLELGARIPKGVLLVGQPGTGKTLLAKAIAGEAGVHFFSISGSDFSEMLVGVGPSRMRDLFETAKINAPAIIFIDEIDSIARMRGVGVSGVSDENEQTLNQLLVQMDGFTKSEGVIVIAATNRPDVLDQALLRPGRFDRQIIVQIPDVKGREQILKVHANGKPLAEDVDLQRVAQIISGFSGADIENLLNESAIIAAKKDKKKINMADITEGINKVILGPQKRSRIITEEDKKITAYHEAGHAIVSRILEPEQTVQEVSIIPRGMAAGYTLTNEKDIESHHKSKKFLTARLAMLMAGRVAEQIFVGDTCTGSSNDLKTATDLAEKMVTMFGMSDKLGPLYYAKEEEMALRLYNAQNPHSEALQSVIDNEIKTLILAAEKSANEILKANKAKAEIMKTVLLERETIYAAEIDLIMSGKNAKHVTEEIDKRNEAAKAQESKDKIDGEMEILNRELDHVLKHSKRFVDAKLAPAEKLEQLKQNMEKAREVVRRGETLTQLPTLDNLDTYDNIIGTGTNEPEKSGENK
jgi:cell division protease FtsH